MLYIFHARVEYIFKIHPINAIQTNGPTLPKPPLLLGTCGPHLRGSELGRKIQLQDRSRINMAWMTYNTEVQRLRLLRVHTTLLGRSRLPTP